MSMEFKKLSDVAAVETVTDTANVLIEEDGVIKKAPKNEVGGAGGYVVELTAQDLESPVVDGWDGPVISQNYDELYDILLAGGSAWIDMTIIYGNNPSTYDAAGVSPTTYDKMRSAIVMWHITDIGLVAGIHDATMILFPNGSHNIEPAGSDDK